MGSDDRSGKGKNTGILQGDLSLEDKVGRACERNFAKARVLVPLKIDLKRVATENVDLDWSRNPLKQVINNGTSHHARATGQSLILNSTFIGSNRKMSRVELFNEIGICAFWEVTVVTDG